MILQLEDSLAAKSLRTTALNLKIANGGSVKHSQGVHDFLILLQWSKGQPTITLLHFFMTFIIDFL